jgi:UDP-N-acetylmuramyl pentapeptide phosphotransferase/UDP-N-acetylglucosamine-1-phosphate transferase
MTPPILIALALAAFAGAPVYRVAWTRFFALKSTPKGYGALLPVFLLAGGALLHMPPRLLLVCGVAAIGTPIYWWDDVGHVSFRVRILIQLASGFAIGAVLLAPLLEGHRVILILCALAAAAINAVLTNAINFFDGADLNSAAMNILLAVLVLAYGPSAFGPAMQIVLAFVVSFALWNAKPERIYFGDSGCFVIACLVTAMTVQGAATLDLAAIVALAPVVWAVFDAFYVFILRLRNREDLLSRNYHHLYQKMQAKYGGWYYLIPQVANVALVLACARLLNALGAPDLVAAPLAALAVPPLFYLACRWTLVDG